MTRYEARERGEGKQINAAIINAIRTNVPSYHLHNRHYSCSVENEKYRDCNSGQIATNILKVAQFVPCTALIWKNLLFLV